MRNRLLPLALTLALLCACAAPEVETAAPGDGEALDPGPTPSSMAGPSPGPTGSAVPVEDGGTSGPADAVARSIVESQSDGADYAPLSREDVEFYLSEVYGLPEDCRGQGAAVYTAGGVDAREIAVVYGLDEEKTESVLSCWETYRQSRAEDFYGYEPSQAALAEEGWIGRAGDCAALLLCTEPEQGRETFARAAGPQEERELPAGSEESGGESRTEPTPDRPAQEESVGTAVTATAAPIPIPEESGLVPFEPPNKTDMTLYDTTPILNAWATGEESGLSQQDAAILAKCREVLEACVSQEMTDFQKELALHDWIMAHCAYDRSVHDPRTPQGLPHNTDPYGMLTGGYGICLGYASTFQLLMDLAGVKCITVVGASSGNSEDHAWNMVELEGEWYCVDVTWDDPSSSRPNHRYFNVTSQSLADSNHQWDYAAVPWTAAVRFRWDGEGPLPQ